MIEVVYSIFVFRCCAGLARHPEEGDHISSSQKLTGGIWGTTGRRNNNHEHARPRKKLSLSIVGLTLIASLSLSESNGSYQLEI